MMKSFRHKNQEIKYETLGAADSDTVIVWTHGWGHSHSAFMPTAQPLASLGFHILVDFPGFGGSPVPEAVWSVEDYADFMAAFLQEFAGKRIIWAGHSFGCRVGVRLAAKYPGTIERMVLVSAAGLRRKRPLHRKIQNFILVRTYKAFKFLIPFGLSEEWLKNNFGSADYRNAGPMRSILVKTVNDFLYDVAPLVSCPTLIISGSADMETPPEAGRQYHGLIPHSQFVLLEGYDHYSILSAGHHQLARLVKEFIEKR